MEKDVPGGSSGSKPGLLRLNPTAAPFVPPSGAPVVSGPPSVSKSASKSNSNNSKPRSQKKEKKKKEAPPLKKRGQKDYFPPNTDKVAPPVVVVAPAASVPQQQPAAKPVVIMLSEKKKPRPRPSHSAASTAKLTELGKDLTRKLESGRYECVICMATIGKKAQVWSCSNCYLVLHLACVKTWASKSGGVDWRCPHCQFVMLEEPKHECYCGKTVRPDADPYLVVNSCGEVCEKHREGTDCPHTCNLVCHPGPCPPCPLPGPMRSCHCGKKQYRLKCSEMDVVGGSSCGEPCGKALACEMHSCERPCHAGPCGECPHFVTQSCFCGKERAAERPCGSGQRDESSLSLSSSFASELHFGCGAKCDRVLACSQHNCTQACHSGNCGPCPGSLIKSCPCGKFALPSDRKCDDPVPVCGNTCSTLRSCGKHQCNTRCCPSFKDPSDEAGMHVCRLPCSKKLRCGKHVCEESCHKGRCGNCPHASFEDWTCECGRTTVLAPIACGQTMPSCPHPCRHSALPRPCGHIDVMSHPCHPASESCPPCVALVDAPCACGDSVRSNVRCHLAKSVTCGRICGMALECGRHKCASSCHKHLPNEQFVLRCDQLCARPLDCEHPCQKQCHTGVCPAVVCEQKATIRCECGRLSKAIVCGLKHSDPEQQKEALAGRPVLPCDDVCAKEIRKKQLAQAFGKQHQNWTDAQTLLGLAKTHPALLRRAEASLAALIGRNTGFVFGDAAAIAPNVVFPAMGPAQRKLVHLLAESYGLKSESFGEDASRSVWVSLRAGCRVPAALLSSVLEQQQQRAEASSSYKASDCGVLLSQLSPSTTTAHLQQLFQPWKSGVVLHWLDDRSCLAVFDDPATARIAVNTLRGPFVATIYKEDAPPKSEAVQQQQHNSNNEELSSM